MSPLARVVDYPGCNPDVATRNRAVGVESDARPGHERVPLPSRSGQDAMRKVVLQRGAIRLERGEVGGVEMEHVLVRDDHPGIAERLVGVHGALDALRQRDRLKAGTEPACGCLEETFEEPLDTLEDAHAADASTHNRTYRRPPHGAN